MPEHDVIVVGAGSAGCAVAALLSEDPSCSVLLLEQGPDTDETTAAEVVAQTNVVDAFTTVERLLPVLDPATVAAHTTMQDPAPYLRGKGLGGTSSINGLFAVRPTAADFEDWERVGGPTWSLASCLPLMDSLAIPVVHPTPSDLLDLDHAFVRAAVEAGHPWCEDMNAVGATGVSPYPYNATDGMRVSSNDAYLAPVRHRTNLTVVTDAVVDVVVLEGTRATGVRYLVGDESRTVTAARVVVCAGAVGSAAVLLRSGIGRAGELDALGIETVVDLPVGQGLQDHPAVPIGMTLQPGAEAGPSDRHSRVVIRWDLTDGTRDDAVAALLHTSALGSRAVVMTWLNQVCSRGVLTLTSTDPRVGPALQFAMLEDERDIVRMRELLLQVERIFDGAQIAGEITQLGLLAGDMGAAPLGPRPSELSTDELEHWLRAHVGDVAHATSTCAVGSVVDASGRVLGVEGLYVADASILPAVPRANTHLPAVLAGVLVSKALAG